MVDGLDEFSACACHGAQARGLTIIRRTHARPPAIGGAAGLDGPMSTFDEVLYSETNGRFRGTGVLTLQSGQWQLEHYAMSFLIFNENWDEVIELTKRTKVLKESGKKIE